MNEISALLRGDVRDNYFSFQHVRTHQEVSSLNPEEGSHQIPTIPAHWISDFQPPELSEI